MLIKKGNIYHAKFKRDKKVIHRSLKTSDLEEALAREAALKAEYEQMQSCGLVGMSKASIATKSIEELKPLAKNMLGGMRHRANKKSPACTITRDDILALLTASGGACAVTGVPLDMDTKLAHGRVSPWMPSIDRIDSNRGYVPGNCRIVCYQANLAMSQFGEGALELLLHHYAIKKFGKTKHKRKAA